MADIVFPLTTPPKTPSTVTPVSNTLYSPTESGHVITRNKFTKIRRNFSLTWDCTEAQYTLVWDFYRNTINGGSVPFYLSFSLGGIVYYVKVILTEPTQFNYNGMGTWEINVKATEV